MRIKRFHARDMAGAMQMVKAELGPDAVILGTRELKDPLPGGLCVEVTAGVGLPGASSPKKALAEPGPKKEKAGDGSVSLKNLEGGLAELRELVLDLTHRSSLSEQLRNKKGMVGLYRKLVEAELDPRLARSLVERAAVANNGGPRNPVEVLRKQLAGRIKVSRPLEGRNAVRRLALVGPSGVGKTTTLAKLAALVSGRDKKKVALIGLDPYRLGAAEQLKTYARIIGLPVRTAGDVSEFRQALELFEDAELVLIDTAGRCLSRRDSMDELLAAVDGVDGFGALLVLSAATKDRDLAAAIRTAGELPVAGLAVTKIDETGAYGNVINNLIKFKVPAAYLTNGQKVPDDIMPADPKGLADLVLDRCVGGRGMTL